jgi:adenylate cyclase
VGDGGSAIHAAQSAPGVAEWRSVPNVYVLPDQRLVECRPGEPILSAALRAGVPFTHACGGRGKCSTCRIVVVEGSHACAGRSSREQTIADQLSFGPTFRLACQTVVTGDVTIRRLVLDERDAELADMRTKPARHRQRGRPPFGGQRHGRRRRARPIGDELDVAVMFADIRGFTAFAESVLPYDVIHVLQRQLRDVTQWTERHGGVVTSYMGDGVMALYSDDASAAGEPASRRAIRSGLAILAGAEAARHGLEELNGRSFDLNVGVHFGPAIVGSLLGEPATVTAIGDTVNMANRIEQANKEFGTRLLVSDAAREHAGDALVLGRSFSCSLPGKAGEHTLFEVLALSD